MNKSKDTHVWAPFQNEAGYEEAVSHVFFDVLAPKLLTSKHPGFDSTVLQRAWNLQTDNQVGIRHGRNVRLFSLVERFYVYVLMDPRKPGPFVYDFLGRSVSFPFEPFYVGKGTGHRMHYHLKEAQKSPKRSHKVNRINSILKSGADPIVKRISQLDIETVAFVKERLLIEVIGRAELGTGPLTNGTEGGDGGAVVFTPEMRAKVSAGIKGKAKSKEHRANLSVAHRGKVLTDKHRENIGKASRGRTKTDEHKRKIGEANKGRVYSAASIERYREAALNRPHVKCPHCPKTGTMNNMKRWHFDNCRSL